MSIEAILTIYTIVLCLLTVTSFICVLLVICMIGKNEDAIKAARLAEIEANRAKSNLQRRKREYFVAALAEQTGMAREQLERNIEIARITQDEIDEAMQVEGK